jgi:hypothetical protein
MYGQIFAMYANDTRFMNGSMFAMHQNLQFFLVYGQMFVLFYGKMFAM